MSLPVKPLAWDSVEIAGEKVRYRSLSRAEALRMSSFVGREDEAEVFLLMCGTGCTEDEAKAFRDSNDMETAGLLIDAIIVVSRLTRKPVQPTGDGRRAPKA